MCVFVFVFVCVYVESDEEEAEEEQVETHTSPEPAQDSTPYYEPPPVRYIQVHMFYLNTHSQLHVCSHSHTHSHFG